MYKKTLCALTLLITSFTNPLHAGEADISVENAWIAEAPPVSKVMAAYLTINNNGDEAITITKAESEMYSSIEFHETIHEHGMAKMIHHDALKIPAHGSIQLKRGGKHLMLFNPVRHLKAGDTVNIKLSTSGHSTKTVSITVKKAQH